MLNKQASDSVPDLAPPSLPDQVSTHRHLDPAAALAFRTPLQEHAPAADTKAAALLTGLGIMLTTMARFGDRLTTMMYGHNGEKIVVGLLLLGFVVLGIASIYQAFQTIFPRFPAAPPTLAFFGDIARLSREDYVARVGAISHQEALDQILIYNHTLATICVDKFRHLNRGIKFFRRAFGCWLVVMVLINLRSLF